MAGRVAIVTGAGTWGAQPGNGGAAALLLARSGVKVMVVGRRAETLRATINAAPPGMVRSCVADVSQPEDCKRVVEDTMAVFGRLDYLDNNVAIPGPRDSVVTIDLEAWHAVLRTNLDSVMLMSRYAVPAIRESGGGSIVNIGSIASLRPQEYTAYAAAKGAGVSLTQAMAVDHGPDHIRVNAVVVGPVFSPLVAGDGMPAEMRDQRRSASPLGIEGSPWDVACAVRFLLSDDARYITGQALVVDGGVTLRRPALGGF